MFETKLSAKFKTIFGVEKVTYNQPSESQEQRCLFIEIEDAKNSFKAGRMLSMIRGKAVLFAQNDQLPFGFFSKAIEQHPKETKDLFFYDMEENTRTYQNLVQRSFSFVYFFDGQYDPDVGTIDNVNLTLESEP